MSLCLSRSEISELTRARTKARQLSFLRRTVAGVCGVDQEERRRVMQAWAYYLEGLKQ
ncbi:hypothetical protein SAMN04487997_2066 [Frateuria terrea]|uniref:Uncharacterized protein n=1 Tax=Frateuria terrea TaxID=529704 RepID=A0A1H6UQ50_9GAMM|nr:hypothetical protein SAMN04487997_2066 [Frateuria terrea]SFP35115.1 hypothetical protein SAMN02927913_1661 [Frateuria terrea]